MEQMGTEKKQQLPLSYMEQMGYDPITFQLANPMAHLSTFHASIVEVLPLPAVRKPKAKWEFMVS